MAARRFLLRVRACGVIAAERSDVVSDSPDSGWSNGVEIGAGGVMRKLYPSPVR